MEKYVVVYKKGINDFLKSCNEYAVQGYIPVGGITAGNGEFFQAFFLEGEPIPQRKPRATKAEMEARKARVDSTVEGDVDEILGTI